MSSPRIIALYLPQFHPIKENDEWWGRGFTEWTNVGKAKPLFKGHYQPRVPKDLGYYDLRLPEVREAQAQLAKEHGIEGFCYWHYWFGNGKRLLERPFDEVLESGKPDFPFCLAWANHTWKAKTWHVDGEDKILIEQLYNGLEDYTEHFYTLLPAFKDKRYIRVNNKPLFMVWDPTDLPDATVFIDHWNLLAKQNGLEGIHFAGSATDDKNVDKFISFGFDSVYLDFMLKSFQNRNSIRKSWFRILRFLLNTPKNMNYDEYANYLIDNMPVTSEIFPSVMPNFDHSPRSGKFGQVLTDESPVKFAKLLRKMFYKLSGKDAETNIVIMRSWNEWAEGNHLEPDLKYGCAYLEAIKEELDHIAKF
jgi:hypothetical protein